MERFPVTAVGFQEQLLSAFPEPTWAPLVRGLSSGIALGDQLITGTPLLASVIGRDIRGLIRRAGILHKISELCAAGDLPFTSSAAKMPIGSWHWLNISSGTFTAHIVKTVSPRALPEDNASRQPECLKNEYDLFEDGRIPPVVEPRFDQRRYAVITFGVDIDGKLAHVAAGMPNYNVTGWLAYINMTRKFREGGSEAPIAPAPVDPATSLKFRKEVEEMLAEREHEGDKKKQA